jgi:hypothetical protein
MTAKAWVRGDAFGIDMPADPAALHEAGTAFLTRALHVAGTLAPNNRVTGINRCDEIRGGSTGRKLLLSVEYARREHAPPRELFVKFSRDFDDPIRDLGRTQMADEVRFALLSRIPDFPITVPACAFADYEAASGTGVLITERIGFGAGGIEPQYEKCRDEDMPEPLAHYEALMDALARLAGADRAGRLPGSIAEQFPFDFARLSVGERAPYTPRQLLNRVARYAAFAEKVPYLLPDNVRVPDFLARLDDEVVRVSQGADAIRAELMSTPAHIALCHWNANVDNAWFWRERGAQRCGLLDWGCVGRMNVAMALWGALSAASTSMWNEHLDTLLARFVSEFAASGTEALDPITLKRQLVLYACLMGITWLLDAPAYIERQVPELASLQSRFDPPIRDNEIARVQLQMLTNVLNLWQRNDIARLLDQTL